MTVADVYNTAVRIHEAGRREEAVALYRQILDASPDHPDALHMLGVAFHQAGRSREGLELITRAISLCQPSGWMLANLAAVQLGLDLNEEARLSSERAVARTPDAPGAWANFGLALRRLGQEAAAVDVLERAVELNPRNASALFHLAVALQSTKRLREAVDRYRQALAVDPEHIDANYDLGLALEQMGDLAGAEAQYRRTLAIQPDNPNAHMNLGNILLARGDRDQAFIHHQRAVAVAPENALTHYNVSLSLKALGRYFEMEDAVRRALRLDPNLRDAKLALGNAYEAQARPGEALACYRDTLAAHPDYADVHNNYLTMVRRDPTTTGPQVRATCEQWARQQTKDIPRFTTHPNSPDPERRLRIGYVSPDFREHSVAFFLEPVIEAHDRQAVEVFCYYTMGETDAATKRIQAAADHWRHTPQADNDAALARMIRQDGVDILVDCAGHSVGNRLFTFARKPAPVQTATLIGHESTTGLTAIDWIMGDPHLTPPGFEPHFTERLLRLPRVFAPFRMQFDPGPPAAIPSGPPLLACFAQPSRLGPGLLETWRTILDRLPGARLLLKHAGFGNPFMKERWREVFAVLGDRVVLEGVPNGWRAPGEMKVYDRVTLMLDTTPQAGATTTLLALWMGVPVVTLAGEDSARRFGATILANAGAPELVARDTDDYIERVVALAQDTNRIAEYRRTLRDRMLAAPISDAVGVTREIEAAYRKMWRAWCAQARAA